VGEEWSSHYHLSPKEQGKRKEGGGRPRSDQGVRKENFSELSDSKGSIHHSHQTAIYGKGGLNSISNNTGGVRRNMQKRKKRKGGRLLDRGEVFFGKKPPS